MKLAFSPEQFFDDEGMPLAAGRVSIFRVNTDNLVPLYLYQAGSYVETQNPIICSDSGRIDGVFFDAAVVTVKVEKRLPDGTYEQIDTYETGLDVPGGKSDTLVTGLNALKETSTTLGAVTVVGYHGDFDCGPRTYVWDPNSTDQADNGCVVASNVDQAGRWLLVWPDEILPAAVYGVTPGHLNNMAALMARPRIYGGSYSIAAPGVTGFPAGNFAPPYTQTWSTTYDVVLDRGTRFGDSQLTAPRFTISGMATDAVGNLQIRLPDGVSSELKLSLIKARTQLAATNAGTIIIDRDNTASGGDVTLYNKLVYAYIEIPSWLHFENSIVLRGAAGTLTAGTVAASGLLKVGNLFRIVPHEVGMYRYYEVYSQGNDNYPTMRLDENQNVLFHNGLTVQEAFDIPAHTVNGTYYPQQWWGYFDDYEDGPVVQMKAKGDVEVTNLKGNLTSTTANVGTLTVTSEARIDKLWGRNYNFIPVFAGLVRSYTDVDLTWTSYGSHTLPSSIPQNARIKIHMTWAWNDSSSVAISDYIHLSGPSGRSFGDTIAIQNCGPQSASFTFEDMYRDRNAQTLAKKSGPIYVIDMNLNLIDIIPPFATHRYMYNGSGWEPIEV